MTVAFTTIPPAPFPWKGVILVQPHTLRVFGFHVLELLLLLGGTAETAKC